jgi:hypothetical protein
MVTKEFMKNLTNARSMHCSSWRLSDCNNDERGKISRLTQLKKLLINPRNELLVISSMIFMEEVEFVRSKGGFIWHVQGAVSNIPIDQRDILVTSKFFSHKAFIPIDEALHECRLRENSFNPMPEPGARWLK